MIRVMVVDDAPIIRESLIISVSEFSDTTVVSGTAGNGEQALEWLDAHYADICITDIRMPVMDGLELIAIINKRYPWMKSLVVSSYDDFQYAKHSIQLNAIDYILKPVDEDLFNSALSKDANLVLEERTRDAAKLLLKRLPQNRTLVNRWLDQIRSLNVATMPLLIVDTLEVLEQWAKGSYYLLNPLSNLWLGSLIEEFSSNKFVLELDEGKDLGLGEVTLSTDMIRSYFRLCAVRRLEEGAYRLMDTMRGARDQPTVRAIGQIKAFIADHYSGQINLQELADMVAMNKSYMCTVFKQETEMTIWSYIVAERMKAARNRLMQTKDRIYEIANDVGYEDVNYFSQLFKKHFGMTPNEYKRRMNE